MINLSQVYVRNLASMVNVEAIAQLRYSRTWKAARQMLFSRHKRTRKIAFIGRLNDNHLIKAHFWPPLMIMISRYHRYIKLAHTISFHSQNRILRCLWMNLTQKLESLTNLQTRLPSSLVAVGKREFLLTSARRCYIVRWSKGHRRMLWNLSKGSQTNLPSAPITQLPKRQQRGFLQTKLLLKTRL